jgi:hypothetical protein
MGKLIFAITASLFFIQSAYSGCQDLEYDRLGWMSVFGNQTETEKFSFIPNFGEIEEVLIASDDDFSTFDIEKVVLNLSSSRTEELNFFSRSKLKSYKTVYKDDVWASGPFNRVDSIEVTMESDDFMSKVFDVYVSFCND